MPEFRSVQDVLTFAISMERISQRFYQELAGRVTDTAVRDFLYAMVQEEARHEAQLRSMVEEDDADFGDEIPSDEIHSYIQAMKVPDELDYKKAVKVAYDKEQASQMLYSILSGLVETKRLSRLLKALSKQEQQHKEFFAREYKRIQLGEN